MTKKVTVILSIAALMLIGWQPAAHAYTRWDTGVPVSASSIGEVDAVLYGRYTPAPRCPDWAKGAVKLHGDILFVEDKCADGKSAFLEYRDAENTGERWICRASRGAGTIAKCDFNWPETTGILIPGLSDGENVYVRDHGNSLWVRN
jgi:hypothetical protein